MPTVEIHLLEGYGPDAQTRLCAAVTDAVRLIVPAQPDAITVMISEHAAHGYMRGRQTRKGADALPNAEDIVRRFLDSLEARDLGQAETLLAPGAELHFPGAPAFASLSEVVHWAAPRYQSVRKDFAAFETCATPTGTAVYARGTLSGTWPDGTSFDGIRFIDRFELMNGLITRQDVWNDIAEVRP